MMESAPPGVPGPFTPSPELDIVKSIIIPETVSKHSSSRDGLHSALPTQFLILIHSLAEWLLRPNLGRRPSGRPTHPVYAGHSQLEIGRLGAGACSHQRTQVQEEGPLFLLQIHGRQSGRQIFHPLSPGDHPVPWKPGQ
jgi:hypothetical protein